MTSGIPYEQRRGSPTWTNTKGSLRLRNKWTRGSASMFTSLSSYWCAGGLLPSIGLRLPRCGGPYGHFSVGAFAVAFHALCAFGSGPNVVAGWRLRKIRELSAPEPAVGAGRAATTSTRIFGILLLGILIGCAAGGGYTYVLLPDARENTRRVQASRDALEKTAKEQDTQLKQMAAEKSSPRGGREGDERSARPSSSSEGRNRTGTSRSEEGTGSVGRGSAHFALRCLTSLKAPPGRTCRRLASGRCRAPS